MTNSIYYSLNHIPLMMTWAYCYNEILPVRKSYWRDYLTLDLSITLAVFLLLHIYALPGSVQDNAVVRMTNCRVLKRRRHLKQTKQCFGSERIAGYSNYILFD